VAQDLVSFLTREYLNGYIKDGGSKVKFFTAGERGTVTEVLGALVAAAAEAGYAVARVDATSVARINLFSHVYQAAVYELDLAGLVAGYCWRVVETFGHAPAAIPPGMDFVSWAAEFHGREPEILCREVRARLERDLFRNRFMNRSFATAVLHLAADELGVREGGLDPEDREVLLAWLRGAEVPLRDLRRFHVFRRVDRYNARFMLRSLAELARLAGRAGLFLAVDGLEVLLAKREGGRTLYGRAARDEFYESIRQLIDGTDTLAYLMVVLGFARELVEDERRGLHSYEALWLRIQHEVAGRRVNLFRDFLDLDAVRSGGGG